MGESATYIPSVKVPHIWLVDEFPIVRQLRVNRTELQCWQTILALQDSLRLMLSIMLSDHLLIIDRDLHGQVAWVHCLPPYSLNEAICESRITHPSQVLRPKIHIGNNSKRLRQEREEPLITLAD